MKFNLLAYRTIPKEGKLRFGFSFTNTDDTITIVPLPTLFEEIDSFKPLEDVTFFECTRGTFGKARML